MDMPVPECLHSGFHWSTDNGGSGDKLEL